MKKIILLTVLFIASLSYAQQDLIFSLGDSQSMSITGQGPGQDAAINPFTNEDSIAIIENLGTTQFTIRTKDAEGSVALTDIDPKQTKDILLPLGTILYLDSTKAGKARVNFKKMTQ